MIKLHGNFQTTQRKPQQQLTETSPPSFSTPSDLLLDHMEVLLKTMRYSRGPNRHVGEKTVKNDANMKFTSIIQQGLLKENKGINQTNLLSIKSAE